ncbi:MAG: TonB-dependent receptor, partial [Bacteroidales bacterium]
VKLNATRNYHLPTLNDLYWLPGGNPNLKPERGYTGDLSFEIKSTNDTTNTSWHTVVTGYLSHINDWIIWRPGEFRYWSATNLKEVFVRGAEFNISASHECLGALDGLKVKTRANWAITHTTNQKPMDSSSKSANTTDNSKGKQLIYIPVHKGNLFLSLNYSGYSLNWHSAYTGERFTTSSNEKTRHSLPSYWLHNLSLKKELTFLTKKITALIEVENLFNTQYQAILWRAMPGTNYSFTLRLDI